MEWNTGKGGTRPTLNAEEYTIGWICALQVEFKAAEAMLDSLHEKPNTGLGENAIEYLLGSIQKQNIVVGMLTPSYLSTGVVKITLWMRHTFPKLRFILLVGIGGGVPSERVDIRLGDIAVAFPTGTHDGVIGYDMGKISGENDFEVYSDHDRMKALRRWPSEFLTGVLSTMKSTGNLSKEIFEHVRRVVGEDGLASIYPGASKDTLFAPTNSHPPELISCEACTGDSSTVILREERRNEWPEIHYGNIGSGNLVIKEPKVRDYLAERYHVICFEMEASGMMNDFPYLVIKGVSDYADSHKTMEWQQYASLTAAAYGKELLHTIAVADALLSSKQDMINSLLKNLAPQLPKVTPQQVGQENVVVASWDLNDTGTSLETFEPPEVEFLVQSKFEDFLIHDGLEVLCGQFLRSKVDPNRFRPGGEYRGNCFRGRLLRFRFNFL